MEVLWALLPFFMLLCFVGIKWNWSLIITIILFIISFGIECLDKNRKFDKIKLYFLKKKQKREKIEYSKNVKELWEKYKNKEYDLMLNGGEIIGNDDYIINKNDNKLSIFSLIKNIAELNSQYENGEINNNVIEEMIIDIDSIEYFKNENGNIKIVLSNNNKYNFNKISIYEYLLKQLPNKDKNDLKSKINKVRIVDKI